MNGLTPKNDWSVVSIQLAFGLSQDWEMASNDYRDCQVFDE